MNFNFDYLSIHQGLLDKVYNKYSIAVEEKSLFTTALHKTLCKKDNSELKKLKAPVKNLIIHSGRSKPSHKDMPQELSFIQYAAIENAFLIQNFL
ncbi:MAG: hypothetical protein LUE98_18900 [Tannerellaceae bacterium]|nr:hypothetical protein [Tannerellaceae bacterium]